MNRKLAICLIFLALILIGCFLIYVYYGDDTCKAIRIIQTDNGTVEIVSDKCQEGLPHTTNAETIRMTQDIWDSQRQSEILIHERVHLDQKRNPQKWQEFYKRFWDYEISNTPPPDLPAEYIKTLRPNPDTRDQPWATWKQRYVFFPVYNDDSKQLRNAKILIWDKVLKNIVQKPAAWKTEFCSAHTCPHQYEHPHELSAEYLTLRAECPASDRLRKNLSF
jgi:hypothetical protein